MSECTVETGLTHQLFYLGEPARPRRQCFQASQTHVKKAFVKKRRFQKPRRRAVRSNVFGLTHAAIPRDAKRQAESPSLQGTHSRQKHNRSHPSRDTRSNQLSLSRRRERSPRPTVFPRRESPRTEFPRRFANIFPRATDMQPPTRLNTAIWKRIDINKKPRKY